MPHLVQNLKKVRVSYDERLGTFWINAPRQQGFPNGYHERVTDPETYVALMERVNEDILAKRALATSVEDFSADPLRVPLGVNLLNYLPVYANCYPGKYSPLTTITGSPTSGVTRLLTNFLIHGLKHNQPVFYWSNASSPLKSFIAAKRMCESPIEALGKAIDMHGGSFDLVWVVLDGEGMSEEDLSYLVKAVRTWRSLYPRIKIVWCAYLDPNIVEMKRHGYQVIFPKGLADQDLELLAPKADSCIRNLVQSSSSPYAGIAGNTPFSLWETPFSVHELIRTAQ